MQESTQNNRQKAAVIWVTIIAVLFLAAIITGVVFLARSNTDTTGRVRDIFIIVLALESLLIGAALIILVIQLAVLTNIIQNEVLKSNLFLHPPGKLPGILKVLVNLYPNTQ